MTISQSDLVKFFSNSTPEQIAKMMELGNRLSQIETERVGIMQELEALGIPAEPASSWSAAPPVAVVRADQLCAVCSEPGAMTVDSVRYCETHGEMASNKVA